ncbi:MAG: TfoX/Sxy family protein [Alphaproteobacteria bacterium]|nr:TfoX/Sxy family protein [Alphaproteobacteria bacterium]
MAYDEDLAERVRRSLHAQHGDHVEKKMFGGVCFMVGGHMTCGILRDEMMVRVGKEAHEAALARPHAREMDFTGRSLKGMVYVAPEGLDAQRDLDAWVAAGLAHARSLPPKG